MHLSWCLFSFLPLFCVCVCLFVSIAAPFYKGNRRANMSSNTSFYAVKCRYQESLGMHTELMSFGLHLPKTADRHERIVFSKAVFRNRHLTQQQIRLHKSVCVVCEWLRGKKPAGGTQKHVPVLGWGQESLHYTWQFSAVSCLHNRTDTNTKESSS